MDIIRTDAKEATNYFFGVSDQDEELELTFNHDRADIRARHRIRSHREGKRMSAVVGASASAGSGRAGRRKEQLPLLRGQLLSPKSGERQAYW